MFLSKSDDDDDEQEEDDYEDILKLENVPKITIAKFFR